jgi:hypothetical protein
VAAAAPRRPCQVLPQPEVPARAGASVQAAVALPVPATEGQTPVPT